MIVRAVSRARRRGRVVWTRLSFLFLLTTLACQAGTEPAPDPPDPWRPALHFTPRRHWMNDPNGTVTVGRTRHLFYQYNPRGRDWGHMSWGHATSRDLLTWTEQEVAIPRTDSTLIFSGGVVRDTLGTSGLCRGPDCLVAIYTAAHTRTRQQAQSLAFSTDGGDSWQQYAGNPVLAVGSEDFRDPWVFWHQPTRQWIMTVARSAEHVVEIYRSADLRSWRSVSRFGPHGATGGVWECPVLLPLVVEGETRTKWVLKVDLNPGHPAGGSGAQYFVGTFDGIRFVPDEGEARAQWVDLGPDFYCAQPWPDPSAEGATAWIGWMSNWRYAAVTPTTPWRGAMSLPRTLQLRRVAGQWRLLQRPVEALHRYRGSATTIEFADTTIADVTVLPESVHGEVLELQLTIVPGAAREVGLLLRRDAHEHVLVAYDAERRVIALDRRPSGDPSLADSVHAALRTRHEATRLRTDDTLTVRIVLDRSSVEVFADDGEVVLTGLIFPAPQATGVAAFGKGGPVQLLRVARWPLRAPR